VTRVWLMTFFDVPRGGVAAHESARAMSWPLVALAVPAALLGFLGLRDGWLARWLALEQAGGAGLHIGVVTSVLSLVLALAGFGAVLAEWRWTPWADPVRRVPVVLPKLAQAFWVDQLYARLFVRPVAAAARAVRWTDDRVVVAAVGGSGTEATRLAGLIRRAQTGNVQTYLTGLLAGVVLLAVGVVTLT
jgi:NADH-quinone oxidoreductase subunit L